MTGAQQRREGIRFLQQKGISQRRGCALLHLARSGCRAPVRPDPNQELRQSLHRIGIQHPCYGYRRAWALLRRGQPFPKQETDPPPVEGRTTLPGSTETQKTDSLGHFLSPPGHLAPSRLDLRISLRPDPRGPQREDSHRRRRIQQGSPGHSGGTFPTGGRCDRYHPTPVSVLWYTSLSPFGQRSGVHGPQNATLLVRPAGANEVHRTRLSLAERLRRKLQRETADGMPEPGGLWQSGRSPMGGRALAPAIQPGSSPQQSGLPHTLRILAAMESEPTREETTPSGSVSNHLTR